MYFIENELIMLCKLLENEKSEYRARNANFQEWVIACAIAVKVY